MATSQYKASVCFTSPVNSSSDSVQIKAAYADLKRQLVEFTNAVLIDPNLMISHTVISEDPKDMKPVGRIVADPHMAELQAQAKSHAKGKTVAIDPNYKPKISDKAIIRDEDDSPKVRAIENWSEIAAEKAAEKDARTTIPPAPAIIPPSKPVEAKVEPKTKAKVKEETKSKAVVEVVKEAPAGLADKIKDAIFENMKRTKATEGILDFFLANLDKEVTVKEITEGATPHADNFSVWYSNTGKKITAISNPSRGKYIFDSTKVKVK